VILYRNTYSWVRWTARLLTVSIHSHHVTQSRPSSSHSPPVVNLMNTTTSLRQLKQSVSRHSSSSSNRSRFQRSFIRNRQRTMNAVNCYWLPSPSEHCATDPFAGWNLKAYIHTFWLPFFIRFLIDFQRIFSILIQVAIYLLMQPKTLHTSQHNLQNQV